MARSPRLHFVSTRLSCLQSSDSSPPWSSSSDSSLHHIIILIFLNHLHRKVWFDFFVMYKNASSSILRAASSRSLRSSLTSSSSASAAASPCSLVGQRSFATYSPAFRSLARWSHCLHSRPSPFRLSSQIRTASPVLDRLEKNFSSMGNFFLHLENDRI